MVEELLIIGRNFEDNFTKLINGESGSKVFVSKLENNSKKVLDDLAREREKIEKHKEQLNTASLIIQSITFLTLTFMVLFFFYYGRKMIMAFQRTVAKTKRIRNDPGYEISILSSDYLEFKVVYQALNRMSHTIQGQIRDLENARMELEARVEERTAELQDMNTKLRDEINERITGEAKRAELEARLIRAQKMEALGMLAGGVAHDLNNILSGVVSYPELILRKMPKDSPYWKKIERVRESGEKAAVVVQDLLTMARRSVANTETLCLNDVINSYLDSPEFGKLSSEHPDITVDCELDDELLNIDGSPFHLSKVVMNLVSNAFEAMPAGGRVTILTKNQYVDFTLPRYDNIEEGDYAVLEIIDQGTGISQDDMERIFEPFYTRKVMGRSGSGLGMAVVWGTVKDHNGYIDVNSVVNRGTTFSLFFPVSRSMKVSKENSSAIQDDIKGHGEHILVVDDAAEQREIAGNMLSELGYRVDVVNCGEEALAYLRSKSADLVVLDMIMEPGMDGLETYRCILQFLPDQKAIIASGYSDMDKVKRAKELGVGVYLRKPYTLKKLAQAIRHGLK